MARDSNPCRRTFSKSWNHAGPNESVLALRVFWKRSRVAMGLFLTFYTRPFPRSSDCLTFPFAIYSGREVSKSSRTPIWPVPYSSSSIVGRKAPELLCRPRCRRSLSTLCGNATVPMCAAAAACTRARWLSVRISLDFLSSCGCEIGSTRRWLAKSWGSSAACPDRDYANFWTFSRFESRKPERTQSR